MNQRIVDKILKQIEENIYLGASLAIFHGGKWQEYYIGHITEDEPTCPRLVYDIASVSKVVGVGTVLIHLIQKGIIDLDEPFQSYYPPFHDARVTIRQLVTHTSGLDPFIPNRNQLDAVQLKNSMHNLLVGEDTSFRYTDVNLILLGFLLENIYGKPLDSILQEEVFSPWAMLDTSYGPRLEAVPTRAGVQAGIVHDPKARILGRHCGSAGLFSTLENLERFVDHYLQDPFSESLSENISTSKPRSIVWNLTEEGWLEHTGYTGPFIMFHRKKQVAAIFLTNRTYLYDDRPLWIQKRKELQDTIQEVLDKQ